MALTIAADGRPASAANFDLDLGGGVKLTLVSVPKGAFTEGSPAAETGRADTETERRVTIAHDFYLGRHPVTVGQFRRFVEETGHRTEAETGTSGGYGFDGSTLVQRREFTWRNPGFAQTDEHPVTIVTYADAEAFTQWLARKTRRRITLPSEAHWEYACRARTTTAYYGGATERDLAEIGWYKTNAGNGTRPVGQKRANAFGLYDMSGNAFEWCRDWSVPRSSAAAVDPEATSPGTATPARRVLRGGSWQRDAKHLRSAARYQSTPGTRSAEIGFRVAAAAGPDGSPAAVATAPPSAPRSLAPNRPAPSPAPGPVRPVAPSHSDPSREGEFPFAAILVVLVIGVVLLVVVAKFLGARQSGDGLAARRPSPDSNDSDGPRPEFSTAADGFWFEPRGLGVGDLLTITYLINGLVQQQQVRVQGGDRQFVFTGNPPTDIQMVEAASTDRPDDAENPDDVRIDTVIPPSPSPPGGGAFRGYPAAY